MQLKAKKKRLFASPKKLLIHTKHTIDVNVCRHNCMTTYIVKIYRMIGDLMQVVPRISQHMTNAPEYINSAANIYEAMEPMQKKDIRHLPVEKEKEIVGLISERDIKTLFALVGANFKLN